MYWQDTFKSEYLFKNAPTDTTNITVDGGSAMTTGNYNVVNGKYVLASDIDSDGDLDGTHDKRQGAGITLKNNDDYTSNKFDWILKADTKYYLHIYLNSNTINKTFTHQFNTTSYPTSLENIKEIYGEEATHDKDGNNVMHSVNFNSQPSPRDYKRASNNPFIMSHANYNNNDTAIYKIDGRTGGGCTSTGTCTSGLGLLIRFEDNALLSGFADTDPTFTMQDLMLILPNLYATSSGTPEEKQRTADATTNISATHTYGVPTSPSKIINIINK